MTIERKLTKTSGATSEAVYVEDVFSTWLYTGNSGTQTITNGIDLATKGGLVWIKNRDNTSGSGHFLHDTSRTITSFINTNGTNQSSSVSTSLTSWNTDGFTLGSSGNLNTSTAGINSFVSWTFRKQPKFFDIVTYTGTGSARTISHALGSTPGMIIVKRTDASSNWQVYHRGLTSAANSIQLNLTNAQASATTVWNSTAPTSSVFSVGTDDTVNASGGTYVAYLFAHDAGGFGAAGTDSVVSCGSFTHNASSDQVINLGWEAQWILVKSSDSAIGWYIVDVMRGAPTGGNASFVTANTASAELTGQMVYPTPTGFAIRSGAFLGGSQHIYLAIRRGPMKTPTDATKVFDVGQNRTSIANQTVGTVGPIDLTLQTQVPTPAGGYHFTALDRLRGSNFISTSNTSAESYGSVSFDTPVGVKNGLWFTAGGLWYNFKRAPGFFDVVCYTGSGAYQTLSHNLGVAPELIIVKNRSNAADWTVGSAYLPDGWNKPFSQQMYLNLTNAAKQDGYIVNATLTTFEVGGGSETGASASNYIAYLFASCPGVSKVGSYTGNGSSQTINCGFTNGARFVLIKRTDSTGNWWVYDSARGIVSANDPALRLNSTAAEVTTADAVDPASSGFIVNQEATCNINVSSGSYIYLAIA